MRLGRLPHDPADVAAVAPHVMASAPVPEAYAPPVGFRVELGYNDQLPTCTVVGLLNSARLWCFRKHGFDLAYEKQRILDFYALVSGCAATESAIMATDGLVMLTVLQTAQEKGFRINSQDVLVPEFKRIEITDLNAIKVAVAGNESAYVGFDLREADLSGDWLGDVSGTVAGGHCAPPCGFDASGFTDMTWGEQ